MSTGAAAPVSEGKPAEAASTSPRRALIWVSGLFENSVDQSVEGFARRLALALDRLESSSATFEVRRPARDVNGRAATTAPMCSIVRTEGRSQTTVDVYGLETEETLVGKTRRLRLPRRLLYVALVLARYAPRMVNVFRRRGKSRRERRQVLYAQFWSVVLLLSFVALLGSLLGTFAAGDIPLLPKAVEGVVLVIGGLSIWKSKLFQGLADSGVVAACFARYLDRPGDRDRALRGDFEKLLDDLRDSPRRYGSIDVVAFSFGALTVINARFPVTDPPSPAVDSIDRLVTLACPFDFVRAYWPHYFQGRFRGPDPNREWINVYSPADVLSSNFGADDSELKPVYGVELVNERGEVSQTTPLAKPRNILYRLDGLDEAVKGWRSLTLEGFRMHGRYWEDGEQSETTVFAIIARQLDLGVPRAG